MKQVSSLIIFAIEVTMAGCASNAPAGPQGRSCADAVPVENAAEQNEWIRRNLQGATIERKSLIECSGVLTNVVTIKQPDGGTRPVYFNMEKAFSNYIKSK